MCGIIGYTGIKEAEKIMIEGLYALEYRGYDSAGIAVSTGEDVVTVKCGGRISELEKKVGESKIGGHCAIGHTRWATHGAPTAANAHPHGSSSLVLVHNGIIDNCIDLRRILEEAGYEFISETDTEAAAHLIDFEYRKNGSKQQAITSAIGQMKGSFAFGIIFRDAPGEIWAVRRDNPLIIALGSDGNYIASDIPALLRKSREIFRPEDDTVIQITAKEVTVFGKDGKPYAPQTESVDFSVTKADKDGYPYFMLKEICEQPDALRRCVSHRITNDLPDFTPDGISDEMWRKTDSIEIISCGSATHAGLVGRHWIEKLAGIPVTVNTASEYRYDPPAAVGNSLAVAISQSGETADTLAALRLAKKNGKRTAAIVNVFGSAIAREADHVIYTNAGPEIAVATTKGYTTQAVILAMMAVGIAHAKGKTDDETAKRYCRTLLTDLPSAVGEIISRRSEIRKLAKKIAGVSDLYYIGRGTDYPAGAECSLKLKEISYIHSESYAAGELKHGTLSLVTENTPVIALASDEKYYDKMCGNIREVRARGGHVILVCGEDFSNPKEYCEEKFVLPGSEPMFAPIPCVVFSQILAYETALLRGCDVDHPRNLAKSVTVE